MNQKPNKYLDKDNLTKIATVANIIGQNGNVAINLQLPDYDFDNGEPVLVETDGYLVPFFIDSDSVFYTKKTICLRFNTIFNGKAASCLVGKDIFALTDNLPEDEDDDADLYFEYIGFIAYDQNNNLLGEIMSIDDIPGNPLIVINNNDKELLVPVFSVEVIDCDLDNKVVKMSIPDGITSI